VVKCADIGGYLGGTAFGRRRVLPAVSPKKSYEGSFCGLVLTIAASFLVAHYWPGLLLDSSAAVIITLAVALNLASQAGDFTESALKRVLGVKDSAQLLPTFGGALDMMDSLVIAVPVAAVAFRIWS
jgi:phosphatidate cytidylyltransferase